MAAEPSGVRSRRTLTPFLAGSAVFHLAGIVALGLVPRRWPLIAGTLFADHCAIAAAGLWPRSTLLGPNLSRLPAAAAARGQIALTFDDGPDPEVTPRVLDLLDRYGARATFFCVGRRAAALRELTAEIARRGHAVENHSHNHPHAFTLYPPRAIGRELDAAQEALATATGSIPRFFRAPAGLRSFLLQPELAARGLTLVSWTRRAFDTVRGRPEAVADRLLTGLSAGDVLLLHDGSAARTATGEPVALAALPRLLEGIAAAGLRAVTFESPGTSPVHQTPGTSAGEEPGTWEGALAIAPSSGAPDRESPGTSLRVGSDG